MLRLFIRVFAFFTCCLTVSGVWAQTSPVTTSTTYGSLPSNMLQSVDPAMAAQLQQAGTVPIGGGMPATAPIQVAVPATTPPAPTFDYTVNEKSDVFGANLFSGAFARAGGTRFNPEYLLQVGDTVHVRLWGAFNFDAPLAIDPQGNVFLPNVGPIRLLGVRNQDLQKILTVSVKQVYRNNVFIYASLAAAEPVRVYVGGYVNRPGLYDGTSMDSLLHFIDLAGGVDPERGSFLKIDVKRGSRLRGTVNLYDFLLDGRMPAVQLADGDVIFVHSRESVVKVSGLAENAKRFEFAKETAISAGALMRLAKPLPQTTHIRVVRNTGTTKNVEYFALANSSQVALHNGDEVEFTADKKPGTITVRVEGEHDSAQEYVLPYGAKLGDLIGRVEFLPSSDRANIQLFRKSVADRQKEMLNAALKSLETSVLTARSATNEESRLRKDEADLMLQWVERAKKVEPSGQVVIAQAAQRDELLLENGDVLRIPKEDGLILVSGEVLFPNAIAYDPKLDLEDYINRAGGYTQSADTSRVVIAHRDGTFEQIEDGNSLWSGSDAGKLVEGSEILVLPKVKTKSIEVTRGITQILYQLAISAKVILNL